MMMMIGYSGQDMRKYKKIHLFGKDTCQWKIIVNIKKKTFEDITFEDKINRQPVTVIISISRHRVSTLF